jgi:hypothetical protein
MPTTTFRSWDGHKLAFPSHLHAGRDLEPTRELVVNERRESTWIIRGNPRVALPLARFAVTSPCGLPAVAPEAVLFYKMVGDRRFQDHEDIANLLPLLDASQRTWLESALAAN